MPSLSAFFLFLIMFFAGLSQTFAGESEHAKPAHADECEWDLRFGVPKPFNQKTKDWRRLELAMKMPTNNIEAAAMIGKEAAILFYQKGDIERLSAIVGIIKKVPIFRTAQTSYDVALNNGRLEKIDIAWVQEILVNLPQNQVTQEEFFDRYGHWTEEPLLSEIGLPQDEKYATKLLGRHAAFFIHNPFDFERTEIIAGLIRSAPVWGSKSVSWKIELPDGSLREIERLITLKHIRLRPQ